MLEQIVQVLVAMKQRLIEEVHGHLLVQIRVHMIVGYVRVVQLPEFVYGLIVSNEQLLFVARTHAVDQKSEILYEAIVSGHDFVCACRFSAWHRRISSRAVSSCCRSSSWVSFSGGVAACYRCFCLAATLEQKLADVVDDGEEIFDDLMQDLFALFALELVVYLGIYAAASLLREICGHGRRARRCGDWQRLERHKHVAVGGECFAEALIWHEHDEQDGGAEANVGLLVEHEQLFHPDVHVVEEPALDSFVAHACRCQPLESVVWRAF